ncbi:hypothetical protein [Actinomycetospora termitidis]|uniref:Uncharacterized protein n=1 Tax=Actinomycetospora termitidis TaxID=3053470 RepID=A0ABT7M7X2_9PSEU|nr:hypothetical protein [Actinomycetospora sp. Odt1-22]MDL5156757.1 hypothetical protein [Actinomycetospora sp. Odt1-22]
MRSAVLLLTGFGLLVAGTALIALGAGMVLGIALIVVGLAAKVVGFLLGDSASAEPGGARTLAGRSVERPRAGIPVGRANLRRGVVSPMRSARPAPPATRHRRAS